MNSAFEHNGDKFSETIFTWFEGAHLTVKTHRSWMIRSMFRDVNEVILGKSILNPSFTVSYVIAYDICINGRFHHIGAIFNGFLIWIS